MSVQNSLVKTEEKCNKAARQYPVLTPLVDIFENEDEIILHAEMPGVAKEDFSIEIDEGKIYLGGSRKLDSPGTGGWHEVENAEFKRVFSLPKAIEAEKVSANVQNGVLHLRLPKSEAAKPRQIKISAN